MRTLDRGATKNHRTRRESTCQAVLAAEVFGLLKKDSTTPLLPLLSLLLLMPFLSLVHPHKDHEPLSADPQLDLDPT